MLGAGKEGQATVTFLKNRYPNCAITIADEKNIDFRPTNIQTRYGKNFPHELGEWNVVIVSPGIPPVNHILSSANMITTPTNIFLAHCKGTVVGITGSKGKSTTTALLGDILKEDNQPVHVVGNIGIPPLEKITKNNSKIDIWIFEMSSYQTSRLEHGPDIALIINLFPDHLDYHGGIEEYYRDKLHITASQTQKNTLIFNAADNELNTRVRPMHPKKISWPHADTAYQENNSLFWNGEYIISIPEIPLKGAHNISNILGAITTAKQFEIENKKIATAIQNFTPLPHRLEEVGKYKNIIFIDDSISTTPESTIAAVRAIENVQTILLGGTDRGYKFEELIKELNDYKVENIILFPDSGQRIKEAITRYDWSPNILETTSMEEALQFAYTHTKKGSVLLSPASPSYSLYKNFEERGNNFQAAIKKLGH